MKERVKDFIKEKSMIVIKGRVKGSYYRESQGLFLKG